MVLTTVLVVYYLHDYLLYVSHSWTYGLWGLNLFGSHCIPESTLDGWVNKWVSQYSTYFLLTMATACVYFQTIACCQKWLSQWTHLGTGGSGESEMVSPSLHQKSHLCCPKIEGGKATTWHSSGSCSPTTACATKIGQRSPGNTLATESARPNIPSSPSCLRISLSSFIGMQPVGRVICALTKYLLVFLKQRCCPRNHLAFNIQMHKPWKDLSFICSFIHSINTRFYSVLGHALAARDTCGEEKREIVLTIF